MRGVRPRDKHISCYFGEPCVCSGMSSLQYQSTMFCASCNVLKQIIRKFKWTWECTHLRACLWCPIFVRRTDTLRAYFQASERTFSWTVGVNKESSAGDPRCGRFCAWPKWPLTQRANTVFCVFNVRNNERTICNNSRKNTHKHKKIKLYNGCRCRYQKQKSPDVDLRIMAVRTVIVVMCTPINW